MIKPSKHWVVCFRKFEIISFNHTKYYLEILENLYPRYLNRRSECRIEEVRYFISHFLTQIRQNNHWVGLRLGNHYQWMHFLNKREDPDLWPGILNASSEFVTLSRMFCSRLWHLGMGCRSFLRPPLLWDPLHAPSGKARFFESCLKGCSSWPLVRFWVRRIDWLFIYLLFSYYPPLI